MVMVGKIHGKVGFVDDGKPRPLYTRYHRDTFQRDLIDLGYYVDVDTQQPVKPGYDETEGNYPADELPTPTTDIEQLRADLTEFGYAMVKEALTPQQLEVFRDRVDQQAAGERKANVGSYTSADKDGVPTNQFLLAIVNKGQCFADAVELSDRSVQHGPLIDQILDEVLGREFICNSGAVAIAGPGGTPQAMHCGQSMIPKPWPPWPYECFAGFLLDDFSAANGGTLVIPRSHRILSEAGSEPLKELPPTTNVKAPAGTCLLMDGRLVHGTGTNRSDALRRLLIMTFHKPFVRQQEQWALTVNRSVYENASPKLKIRLGFQAWHGGLGGFEGHGQGSVAPLRDEWQSVGELTADGQVDGSSFSVHSSETGKRNQAQLQKMKDADQMITHPPAK